MNVHVEERLVEGPAHAATHGAQRGRRDEGYGGARPEAEQTNNAITLASMCYKPGVSEIVRDWAPRASSVTTSFYLREGYR